jgi:hypothetical protein
MVWQRVREERDRGGEPFSLAALAEAIIKANGGGKFEIQEFPPERKRIDVGDFLIDGCGGSGCLDSFRGE